MYIAIDPSYSKPPAISWSRDKNSEIFFDSVKFSKSELKKENRDLFQMAQKVFKYLEKLIKNVNNKENISIAIEAQYFSVNKAMTIHLVEVRALIQGQILAKYPKIKQYTVDPRKWQANVLYIGRAKSAEIKKISVEEAKRITGKNPTEDESDAIHILRFLRNDFKPVLW